MSPTEQKKAAKQFVERRKTAEGSEDREARSFWIELCQNVLGIVNPTLVLDFERKVKGRKIDVFYEDMGILIENKSRGVSLDEPEQRGKDKYGNPRMVTPYEQAKWYADNITPRSVAPKWILTCNFDAVRIYDLDDETTEENYETLLLDELPDLVHRLSFFTRKENSRLEREKQLSVAAGEVVGKLYDAFAKAYLDIENNKDEQRSLNMLIMRIVFLLYAEDADLLHERNAFYNYLKNFQVAHMRQALIDLFAVLKTPDDERDPYLSPELSKFPYVNGGLFKDDVIIPQFDADARFLLLQEASAEFDWADISPTIFGAVFESTLNPETRRSGGMHYTSIENIHKVTGPLFYDALKDELTSIEGSRTEKERKFKLNAFRNKIASIRVLDPACASGNFLTETYLSLRKLENRVLEDLYGGHMVMGMMDPIQVQVDQFYGIEVNDFAVEVAKTALWIAELQMLDQTREILSMWIDPLPLKSNDNIMCANALRMDWNDVLPASEASYVVGNPPFVGHQWRTKEQQADMAAVFEGWPNYGKLDYVAAWYAKAAEYGANTCVPFAFVSTNSICQGEVVRTLWEPLFEKGYSIAFAYPTFVWNSEATDQAHVHVVIVGCANGVVQEKRMLFYPDETKMVSNINGYLADAPNVFIESRGNPVNAGSPKMTKGSQPTDGGNLILDEDEKHDLVSAHPELSKVIRQFMGGKEFINGHVRYCLWFDGCDMSGYVQIPEIRERLAAVRAMRESGPTAPVQRDAETPWLFTQNRQPSDYFIALPTVSSARREYIPVGYLSPEIIISDQLRFIPTSDKFILGLLMSTAHNAWMRIVCGRLKSDYRYAPAVWNSLVWPQASELQKTEIISYATRVLEVRDCYQDASLAILYDPDKMPDDLRSAHRKLDMAVEAAYGIDFQGDEAKIVAHLFKLYAQMTGER